MVGAHDGGTTNSVTNGLQFNGTNFPCVSGGNSAGYQNSRNIWTTRYSDIENELSGGYSSVVQFETLNCGDLEFIVVDQDAIIGSEVCIPIIVNNFTDMVSIGMVDILYRFPLFITMSYWQFYIIFLIWYHHEIYTRC